MCLCNIKKKDVSNGTVPFYKVFSYNDILEHLVSPFERYKVPDTCITEKTPYRAVRLGEDIDYEFIPGSYGIIRGGFIHGYEDESSTLHDFFTYYNNNNEYCLLVKGHIPEGVTYYTGSFDDEFTHAIAAEYFIFDSIELCYSTVLSTANHNKLGKYHYFIPEGKTLKEQLEYFKKCIKYCKGYTREYYEIDDPVYPFPEKLSDLKTSEYLKPCK